MWILNHSMLGFYIILTLNYLLIISLIKIFYFLYRLVILLTYSYAIVYTIVPLIVGEIAQNIILCVLNMTFNIISHIII